MTREPGTISLPGEKVEVAGVYQVIHRDEHRKPHEVMLLAEQSFPSCEHCGNEVRFRLLRTAPYLFDDPDFRTLEDDEHKTN